MEMEMFLEWTCDFLELIFLGSDQGDSWEGVLVLSQAIVLVIFAG